MKINRNKGNLQNELQKMLQAGRENVGNEAESQPPVTAPIKPEPSDNAARLRAIEQTGDTKQAPLPPTVEKPSSKEDAKPKRRQTALPITPQKSPAVATQEKEDKQRLNASQRHEVPDHNAKYAGEPIKSVGCRMPQSLYARMLQYKALNDSQVNRITLNDIIIEAVEKFLDER